MVDYGRPFRKQETSFAPEKKRITKEDSRKVGYKKGYRFDPPAGAVRRTDQTTLRCFLRKGKVLSGQGKGRLKETFQVIV